MSDVRSEVKIWVEHGFGVANVFRRGSRVASNRYEALSESQIWQASIANDGKDSSQILSSSDVLE